MSSIGQKSTGIEGSISVQYALQGKTPAHTFKTTISDLTLETQGTVTVSTIKESFNGNERRQLGRVKNYTVLMARRSPVHTLKTTISGWTVKKQGSTTV